MNDKNVEDWAFRFYVLLFYTHSFIWCCEIRAGLVRLGAFEGILINSNCFNKSWPTSLATRYVITNSCHVYRRYWLYQFSTIALIPFIYNNEYRWVLVLWVRLANSLRARPLPREKRFIINRTPLVLAHKSDIYERPSSPILVKLFMLSEVQISGLWLHSYGQGNHCAGENDWKENENPCNVEVW